MDGWTRTRPGAALWTPFLGHLALLVALGGCSRPQFEAADNGRVVEIDRHDEFRVSLAASHKGLDQALQFSRNDPVLSGGAVRFLGRRHDPETRLDHFEFVADGPGEVLISFARSFDKSLPKSPTGRPAIPRREIDYTLTVRIRP